LSTSYGFDLSKIPNSIKILLENLIRNEDGESVTKEMISNLCEKIDENKENYEISFSPTRVLMQ
jgi:aconitate hydratase